MLCVRVKSSLRHCQCQVVVRTDNLELAGEVVQDAAAYLGLADLESTAHFPTHMQDFRAVMVKVSTCRVIAYITAASISVCVTLLTITAYHLASQSRARCRIRHSIGSGLISRLRKRRFHTVWVWKEALRNLGGRMQVAECNTNRLKMMAEAADSSMAIKILVVKVPHPVPLKRNAEQKVWYIALCASSSCNKHASAEKMQLCEATMLI